MPNFAQNNAMSNAQFTQSDILKFIQQNGTRVLWREVTGLDSVTQKVGSWPGGKEVRYHLVVDPGALAFGGLAQQGGVFAPADRAYGIQGFMVPKYQTMTMYFDRILDKLSDSDKKAYIGHMKMEYEQKTMYQKSFMNLQQMSDGTGRFATPIGLGDNNTASGASFTLTGPSSLLKVKLSSLDSATGGAPYLMEGSILSLAYPSYDEAADGTAELTKATAIPRLLTLAFKTSAGTQSYYDAFRVVRVSQVANEVLLAPARRAAPVNNTYAPYSSWDSSHHVQQGASANMWCDGTGSVTVKPYIGRKFDLTVPGTVTAIPDFVAVFNPQTLTGASAANNPTAAFLVSPGYLPTGSQSYGTGNTDFSSFSVASKTVDEIGRYILGLGWDINVDSGYDPTAVDVGLINPFLMTGLDTLLFNKTNMVQGIPRYAIQQYLPTDRDNNGNPLNFNTLFGACVEHVTRNRDKDAQDNSQYDWSALIMNPIVYSSLLSLSETDRRITDDKGIRGTSCKSIQFMNKKFELTPHSVCRTDRIVGIPKGAIKMYGAEMEPVTADGQKTFISLNSNGRRTNALEQYYNVSGEQYLENPRGSLFVRNFSVNTL